VSYIDEVAGAIRRRVPERLIPEGDADALFRIYAVLVLAKGESVEHEDVHDAWSAWMTGHDPDHRSLKPLAELPSDVRDTDEPYLEALRMVARERQLGRCAKR
jgi:hypothetical protein